MKNARFQYEYRDNSSKLHKLVGDILRSSIFQNYKIYQEYPVNKINPKFPSGREKFDWYIKDLNIVIEVHGEQHYFPVTFGDMTELQAEQAFARQKVKDAMKQDAAEAAKAVYIIFKYDEEINEELVIQRILNTKPELSDKFELPDSDVLETEEEIQHKKLEKKERKAQRLTQKEKASQRRKEIRERFLNSKKHRDELNKQKQLRKQRYKELKEKLKLKKAKKNGKTNLSKKI